MGIDIGSTTVKIAVLNNENEVLFSDYERHFANIRRLYPTSSGARFIRSVRSVSPRSSPVPEV